MIHDYQLRQLYLADLNNPDTFHGRTSPKVRNPQAWANITTRIKNPTNHRPLGRVWIWSDIHFNHKNIIQYTAPHRPFETKEQMNAHMVAEYLNNVKDDDISIWCGDIGFSSASQTNDILRSLPGYKIHIVGNHDMHRDGTLYDLDFDERHLCLPWAVERNGRSYTLLLTHYPMDNVPDGCVNVHGHIHQNLANAWNINVCVEHTNCAPLPIDSVYDRAEQYLFQK